MNTARVEVETANGVTKTVKEETLDPLERLWTPGKHAHARVGLQVGTQHDFGRIKVTAYVDYECNQNEATVNEAGMLAFSKAIEFVHDALAVMLSEEKSG